MISTGMVIKKFIMINASDKGLEYEFTCIESLSQLLKSFECSTQ